MRFIGCIWQRYRIYLRPFVLENERTHRNAFFTDIGPGVVAWRRNQRANGLLRFVAERAAKRLIWAAGLAHGLTSPQRSNSSRPRSNTLGSRRSLAMRGAGRDGVSKADWKAAHRSALNPKRRRSGHVSSARAAKRDLRLVDGVTRSLSFSLRVSLRGLPSLPLTMSG